MIYFPREGLFYIVTGGDFLSVAYHVPPIGVMIIYAIALLLLAFLIVKPVRASLRYVKNILFQSKGNNLKTLWGIEELKQGISLGLLTFLLRESRNVWSFNKHNTSYSNELVIVFGITSGVLSLMGLVAIFVSMNSQHRIQICRETLLEMRAVAEDEWDTWAVASKLRTLLRKYASVVQPTEAFVELVTRITRAGIILVLILWTAAIGLLDFGTRQNELLSYLCLTAGIIILLFFHYVLRSVKDITKIAGVSGLYALFDGRTTRIPYLHLAATNLHAQFAQNGSLDIYVEVPVFGFKYSFERFRAFNQRGEEYLCQLENGVGEALDPIEGLYTYEFIGPAKQTSGMSMHEKVDQWCRGLSWGWSKVPSILENITLSTIGSATTCLYNPIEKAVCVPPDTTQLVFDINLYSYTYTSGSVPSDDVFMITARLVVPLNATHMIEPVYVQYVKDQAPHTVTNPKSR